MTKVSHAELAVCNHSPAIGLHADLTASICSGPSCVHIEPELLISRIRFVYITNWVSWYHKCVHIPHINKSNCWYQQLELLISRIRIADISNSIHDINNSNCWYQECAIKVKMACHRGVTRNFSTGWDWWIRFRVGKERAFQLCIEITKIVVNYGVLSKN